MVHHALIIDDNPSNLIVLEQALHLEGVVAHMCDHPKSVDALLGNVSQIDVVFLDLEFPNYNGLDLIKEFRADSRLADVPFVAYTVHISEQNEAHAAGFHSFLGKPLDVDRFPEQLAQILNNEPVWETGQ